METKVMKNGKLLNVNLLVSPDGEVLAYGADATYLAPLRYHGLEKDYFKSNSRKIDDWEEVDTGNPYGSYEENCTLHALGAINMDDPSTY